jgi:hypothetical protein
MHDHSGIDVARRIVSQAVRAASWPSEDVVTMMHYTALVVGSRCSGPEVFVNHEMASLDGL